MTNTPKLSHDVDARFNRLFTAQCRLDGKLCYDSPSGEYSDVWFGPDELKQFIAQELAQAKQEQKEADAKMAEGMKKKDCGWTGHGVLPKHMGDYEQIQAAKVYGYISGCTDIAKAIREGE